MLPFSPSFLKAVVGASDSLSDRFTKAVVVSGLGQAAQVGHVVGEAVPGMGADFRCKDENVLDVGTYRIVGENTLKGVAYWKVAKHRKDGTGVVKATANVVKDVLAAALTEGKVSVVLEGAVGVAA